MKRKKIPNDIVLDNRKDVASACVTYGKTQVFEKLNSQKELGIIDQNNWLMKVSWVLNTVLHKQRSRMSKAKSKVK